MNCYDIHINFPGGMPVDGPSAGIAIFCAVYSALFEKKCDNKIAMTGEISIYGEVLPVGGVSAKIEGAKEAGAKKVLIPADNWQQRFSEMGIEVKSVQTIAQVLEEMFSQSEKDSMQTEEKREYTMGEGILTAQKM